MTAAQKILMQTPTNEVRKFSAADINVLGQWLLGRLRSRWPKISDANFAGHVRQIMGANDKLLVRTDQGVALADLTYDPLDSVPVVRAVFVWTFVAREHLPKMDGKDYEVNVEVRRESNRQGIKLLRAIQAWASNMKAKRVELGDDLDIDPGVLKAQIAPTERVTLSMGAEVRSGGRKAADGGKAASNG